MNSPVARVHAAIGTERYRTRIQAGQHILISDEPRTLGGQDEGCNPFELLASSLAACTCATLRMYADRKGWPLTGVETEVLLHRDDAGTDTVWTRHISLKGDLDAAQKSRVLAIANACPVHKILSGTITIETDIL